MSKSGVLMDMVNQDGEWTGVAFWCPGCNELHEVNVKRPGAPQWNWDGNRDQPTFNPSILVRSGHYAPGNRTDCWCTYNAAHPDDPAPYVCVQCHSYVRAGMIQFLSDSSHPLSGQTVPLPAWPKREQDGGD